MCLCVYLKCNCTSEKSVVTNVINADLRLQSQLQRDSPRNAVLGAFIVKLLETLTLSPSTQVC